MALTCGRNILLCVTRVTRVIMPLQGPGMAISYCWIEWLQSSCLAAIGITSTLHLSRLSTDGHSNVTRSQQQPQHDSHSDDRHIHSSHPLEGSPTNHHSDSETSSSSCIPATYASGTCSPQHLQRGNPSRHSHQELQHHNDSSGRQQEMQTPAEGIDPQHSSDVLMIRLVQYDAARGFALFQQVNSSSSSSSSCHSTSSSCIAANSWSSESRSSALHKNCLCSSACCMRHGLHHVSCPGLTPLCHQSRLEGQRPQLAPPCCDPAVAEAEAVQTTRACASV